jgi:hypothetical protein
MTFFREHQPAANFFKRLPSSVRTRCAPTIESCVNNSERTPNQACHTLGTRFRKATHHPTGSEINVTIKETEIERAPAVGRVRFTDQKGENEKPRQVFCRFISSQRAALVRPGFLNKGS